MTKSYVIHEDEVHFGVAYNIDTFGEDGQVFSTPLKSGELYVHQGVIYLGKDDKWYKVDIGDIREFREMVQAVTEEECHCVLGSEITIREERSLFRSLVNLTDE